MKKTIIAATLSFLLGFYANANLNNMKSHLNYRIEEGFYERPYNLEVIVEKNSSKRLEVYLQDNKLYRRYKIGPGPHLGDLKHRVKGIVPLEEKDIKWLSPLLDFLETYFLF